jgi:hypothetical protein
MMAETAWVRGVDLTECLGLGAGESLDYPNLDSVAFREAQRGAGPCSWSHSGQNVLPWETEQLCWGAGMRVGQ